MTPLAVRSRARMLLAVCLALPAAIHAQPQAGSSSTQDTFHIHGIVQDSHTGKPISRAVVEAYNGRLAALTDHDGRFALTLHFTQSTNGTNGTSTPFMRSLMNAGSIYLGLAARKPGYTQDNTQRQIQQVALSALDSDLVIRLIPESTIQGRIATPVDDHPEGVRVMLFSRRIQEGSPVWAQSSTSVTDSRGEFRFAGLQPGHYRLLTQDWSDDPERANILTLADAGKPVSRFPPTAYPANASGPDLKLAAGDVEQVNLNLHSQTYVPVRIPVVLPEGSNQGMQVRVQRAGNMESGQSGLALRYVSREKAVQGLLPSGQYEITLQANGIPGSAASGPVASGSAAVVSLTVGGSRVETAPVTLQPMPSIPVIIHQDLTRTNSSGAQSSAIAGRAQGGIIAGAGGHVQFPTPVQVLLIPQPGTSQTVIAHRSPGSDDTVLEPVPPGTYHLEANAPDGYIAAATSGGTDLLRQPLVVTPGSGVQPIELTIRDDTATLRGTLDSSIFHTNSDSTANAQAMPQIDTTDVALVTCIPTEPNNRRLLQVVVRRDGTFRLGNLPPGSYRVYASRTTLEGFEYQSEAFTREYGSKAQTVTLEANGNATITITSIIEELKDP